jgi:hypothetical protein
LFGFALEGDASGEDSQIQALFFYQTSGGLPAKVRIPPPDSNETQPNGMS